MFLLSSWITELDDEVYVEAERGDDPKEDEPVFFQCPVRSGGGGHPVNEDQSKPSDYVAAWLTAHREDLGGRQQKFAWREEYSRMFCAEFETRKYLLQFCAWDHGCCLDIIAINKATTHEEYTVAGECTGVAGLAARLDTLLQWLDANESNRNAQP